MKLTYKCPICDKQLKLKEEIQIVDSNNGNSNVSKLFSYTCGHIFSKSLEHFDKSLLDFTSVDGTKHARPYQEDGISFILESDFNCIIGDQMRLGKTPQSLLALKNRYQDRTPCLILVKSANLWQWIREFKTWTDEEMDGIFAIIGGNSFIPWGFKTYIMSMDTFALNAKCKICGHSYHEKECRNKNCTCKYYVSNEDSPRDKLKKLPFKLIIADEAHSFKNSDSNRSQALVDFVNFQNTGESINKLEFTCPNPSCEHTWTEEGKIKYDKRIGAQAVSKSTNCPKCNWYIYQQAGHKETVVEDKPCGLILLTGTPILNRAEEYFVPLNLVNPEKFSSIDRFRRQWLIQDSRGRYSRIQRYKIDEFKKEIAPYVLRREKEDVYKELPKLNKLYTLIEPDTSTVAKQYNNILDKIEAETKHKNVLTWWDLKDSMAELRRLCGMMKLMWTADYLETCALDTTSKYAIGIHHESVRDILYLKMGGSINCMKLSGEDSAEKKDHIMRTWETNPQQFLIINMLAGGIGMDFHYCDNVVILERQWNSEMESQFEFRFYNPDMSIKKNPTNVEYVIAKGTLDEWWYDMVEGKRKNVGETVYNNWDLEKDTSSFKELVERTLASRL